MEKILIECFNLLAIAGILSFPFFKTTVRGIITIGVVTVQVIIASIVALSVFTNGFVEYFYSGSMVTGIVSMRIDYLSAWFILIISFTFLTGVWYGAQYLKKYIARSGDLAAHAIAFMLVYTSLIDICIIQNGIVMIIVWEIMALGSFVVVIFDHAKVDVIRAGINYLIQSHVCLLFLTFAFIWVNIKTGSFAFSAITTYTSSQPVVVGFALFICFFIGFAIKAGFVPFHTWLPLAHPAAPAHISGVMSGVIIKIGIYGILRMLLLIKTDMTSVGYFVLVVSVVSGVYGVMLAIVQHDFKKLLAYHSIENIGIIGIGIGLGCLGVGAENSFLTVCGFCGALLHTLNHSLFKSLLFYCAGNVYQATHTLNIEALGGLLKRMPRSAYLFLIGSLAICGLPPLNGFVSEYLMYIGMYKGMLSNDFVFTLFVLFAIVGLVLIGGLALICFAKAFGIVFLGKPRVDLHDEPVDEGVFRVYPLYLIALVILLIGVFPVLLSHPLMNVIQQYHSGFGLTISSLSALLGNLTLVGCYSLGGIALITLLFAIRSFVVSHRSCRIEPTWGCAFNGDSSKMQYTASSFIRGYRKLAEPVLCIHKDKVNSCGIFPMKIKQVTHPGDKIEDWCIDMPIHYMRRILNRFVFLQNGNIQTYLLYGLIFMGLVVLWPFVLNKIVVVMEFLSQL